MTDTPKSDDVTLDPETLERLRTVHAVLYDAAECGDPEETRALEQFMLAVAGPKFVALLDAHERLPQVEAERDQLCDENLVMQKDLIERGKALEAERYDHERTRDALALTKAHRDSARNERDALQAKLDKVRELAYEPYDIHDARNSLEEIRDVLNDA